jgi:hypothetical protein
MVLMALLTWFTVLLMGFNVVFTGHQSVNAGLMAI